MTEAQYKEQNALGFEGDSHLKEKIIDIIAANGINCIVETGSYYGATTKQFSEMVPDVYTVEIVEENYKQAIKNNSTLGDEILKHPSDRFVTINKHAVPSYVKLFNASSPDVLPRIIQETKTKRCLFFLDAHWQDYCPLLDELKLIAEAEIEPVIAIHDFKVPNHPELGFDSYKGQDYTFEWIKESVEAIYGVDGYNVEYNSEAVGAKRGVIFLSPKW